eukprot:10822457-Karenia_brevis.AAC.1
MAPVTSLRLTSLDVEETKDTTDAIFVYDGNVMQFHEWESHTSNQVASTKDKADIPETMNLIIEGLRGEAAQ